MRRYLRSFLANFSVCIAVVGCTAGIVGCSNDTAGVAPMTAVSKFWSLRLNHHAITLATMAPYDTLTLSATPLTVGGTRLATDSVTVTYASTDPAVIVSPTGVLKANTSTQKTDVLIIAQMTIGRAQSVTRADTAYVNVLDTTNIPTVLRLSIQRPYGDTVPIDSLTAGNRQFYATVLDASNTPLTAVPIYYSVPPGQAILDISDIQNGGPGLFLTVIAPGHVVIHAEATVFGTTVSDSFRLTIGYPALAVVHIDTSMATGKPTVQGFPNDTLFIGKGGSVVWVNRLYGVANDSADVEFTDPTNVAVLNASIATDQSFIVFPQGGLFLSAVTVSPDNGGDVMPFFPELPPVITDSTQVYVNFFNNNGRGRTFPIPGAYTYHSRFFPGVGVIRVVSSANLP